VSRFAAHAHTRSRALLRHELAEPAHLSNHQVCHVLKDAVMLGWYLSSCWPKARSRQFYRSAEAALVPNVVQANELAAANGLNGFSMNTARLAGPAIGSLLVALEGLRGVVLFDAASSFVAALTVLFARIAAHAPGQAHVHPLWREWLLACTSFVASGFRAACFSSSPEGARQLAPRPLRG
jgi:hypothetical protein